MANLSISIAMLASTAEASTQQEAVQNGSSEPKAPPAEPPLVTALDIRVGKIVKIEEHPDADRHVMYCTFSTITCVSRTSR